MSEDSSMARENVGDEMPFVSSHVDDINYLSPDDNDVPGETYYDVPEETFAYPRRMKFSWENELDEEDVPEESSSPETLPYDNLSFARGRSSARKFQSLHSSLKSAFDEYSIRFDDMEGELIRGKSEIKKLAKRNKKLEEDLKRAKKGEESSKRNLEQTRNKLRGLCKTFAAVKEECDQVYNQQEHPGAVPQLSKKRKYVLELLNCPICFEPWAQSGEHYACSLSCGHFFGKACITQWILRDGSLGSSICPVCSSRATLSDIRHHFYTKFMMGR